MSAYGSEAGAWDGGPPGAEADYAPQPPSSAAPMPTTDPWTGVSYSHYGPPQYDYQAYGAHTYGYNYDSSYYQAADGAYYDPRSSTYPPQPSNYDYQGQPKRPHSPYESRGYEPGRRPYQSKSRSVSYERREREYSRNRESSYEVNKRHRSRSRSIERSRSRSVKSKRTKYSSSDSSSGSRSPSYSRSSKSNNKKRRSMSSNSSSSDSDYKKVVVKKEKKSLTPPLANKATYSSKRSNSPGSDRRSRSKTPKIKLEKSSVKPKSKYHSSKELNVKVKIEKEGSTPPRKRSPSPAAPKARDRKCRSPATPPRKCATPPRKQKYKEHRSESSKRPRESSVTPPRCYARERSSASSRSRSRSFTPKKKRARSRTPKPRRSRSSSSESSASSRSQTKSKRRPRRKPSREKSRSASRSKKRSASRSRSRKRSMTPRKSKSKSRSRSGSDDDKRRGQFTVADRKRYWKMHRSKQEQRDSAKSPPKEVKPPPGAVESTTVDDIEYGDPPEVEGPNFAELLPNAEFVSQVPSTSKSKALPLPIKNDGSFLEMFKKMQEETKKTEVVEKKSEIKKPVLPFIGKRRGGRVLKTGLVKKAKAIDEQTVDNTPKDAWSLYMQEVKKYRETSCEEERKTRPLVK